MGSAFRFVKTRYVGFEDEAEAVGTIVSNPQPTPISTPLPQRDYYLTSRQGIQWYGPNPHDMLGKF